MCLEIQYTYPGCNHLVKVGKYACYHARHVHHDTQDSSCSPPAPSSPSTFPPDTPCPIRVSHIAQLYSSPKIKLRSVDDRRDLPSPLRLGLGKNLKEKPVTIKTLLSRRYEDTSRMARGEAQYFNFECELYSIYQQPLRIGDRYCYRCAMREMRKERFEEESGMGLLGVEDGEQSMSRPHSRGKRDSIRVVVEESNLGIEEGVLDREFGKRMCPRTVVDEVERDTEAVRRARETARREVENAKEDLKGLEVDIGDGDVDMMDVDMLDNEVEHVEHVEHIGASPGV